MRHIPPAVATAAVLVLTLLTACTGEDPAAAPVPTGGPAQNPAKAVAVEHSLSEGLSFPVERYEISDADQRILERALDTLARRCMDRYGLDYVPAHVAKATNAGPYTYLYGVDDPVVAAEYGYMDPRGLDPAAYRPARARELTEDEQLVMYGIQEELDTGELPTTLEESEAMKGPVFHGKQVPVTGCMGDSQLRINRPDKGWIDPTSLGSLQEDAAQEADDDPRVKALLGEWSACMAGHGYRVKSPLTARDELKVNGDRKLKQAIRAAVQDVACKTETDLVKRWAAVDAEYQKKVIGEHRDYLRKLTEQQRETVQRAREVLGPQ
ncbi:hypothetical protein SRB5_37570 [Streptomyces sp. RB5]|uniref:Lipoprotein n=1 Tax=Streptomyces smaragdinus TaxID=2585196 RepID=A0A7K0CJG4_9ACTN|nr:hypothetical protein [Streptomyces smaragdinus]MQY13607.1 hypothetical protein [Streptomyces smaragdinus]